MAPAQAFVVDGDQCRVVVAATTAEAKRKAADIAKARECRDEEECRFAEAIEAAFTRPARIDVELRPWDYE